MTELHASEREAYLALALVPGIGPARMRTLLESFQSPSGVLAVPLACLREVPELPAEVALGITRADRGVAKRALSLLRAAGGSLLLPEEPRFPAQLCSIPNPPTYLFVQGNLDLLERPAVAIVGSRDHTHYGAEVCRSLARAAAEAGLVVVSGMARGLDAIAHAGALEVNGGTIGVLGSGLGVIYPASNRGLYEEVVTRGLLLTEFLPGEHPGRGSFPRRNRLISGLARVTVVVEAVAWTSGALQTSRCAVDQGREVLAVPGPITSAVSFGSNDLIRDGAAPLLELDDLLCHYRDVIRARARAATPPAASARPLEQKLLNALLREPLQTERLVELSGAPVVEALDALSALELSGKVQQEAGGQYRLVAAGLFR